MTNGDITKAMTSGGKLLDARLARTNGILSKAIVPLARLMSDFGEKNNLSMEHYTPGLNSSLRLLPAAFNYVNHIHKEVARIHMHDSALAKLCSWECEVGTADLFPVDVAKKCEEMHKTRKLGRSFYKHKPAGSVQKRFKTVIQAGCSLLRVSKSLQGFLGPRPQGRGTHRKPPF